MIPTILILAADSVLGALLLRIAGPRGLAALQRRDVEGRVPHREVVDGVLVIFGGAFLITPGFITDIFGFLLLLPPTRALIRQVRGASASGGAGPGRVGCARAPRASAAPTATTWRAPRREYDAPSPRLEQ